VSSYTDLDFDNFNDYDYDSDKFKSRQFNGGATIGQNFTDIKNYIDSQFNKDKKIEKNFDDAKKYIDAQLQKVTQFDLGVSLDNALKKLLLNTFDSNKDLAKLKDIIIKISKKLQSISSKEDIKKIIDDTFTNLNSNFAPLSNLSQFDIKNYIDSQLKAIQEIDVIDVFKKLLIYTVDNTPDITQFKNIIIDSAKKLQITSSIEDIKNVIKNIFSNLTQFGGLQRGGVTPKQTILLTRLNNDVNITNEKKKLDDKINKLEEAKKLESANKLKEELETALKKELESALKDAEEDAKTDLDINITNLTDYSKLNEKVLKQVASIVKVKIKIYLRELLESDNQTTTRDALSKILLYIFRDIHNIEQFKKNIGKIAKEFESVKSHLDVREAVKNIFTGTNLHNLNIQIHTTGITFKLRDEEKKDCDKLYDAYLRNSIFSAENATLLETYTTSDNVVNIIYLFHLFGLNKVTYINDLFAYFILNGYTEFKNNLNSNLNSKSINTLSTLVEEIFVILYNGLLDSTIKLDPRFSDKVFNVIFKRNIPKIMNTVVDILDFVLGKQINIHDIDIINKSYANKTAYTSTISLLNKDNKDNNRHTTSISMSNNNQSGGYFSFMLSYPNVNLIPPFMSMSDLTLCSPMGSIYLSDTKINDCKKEIIDNIDVFDRFFNNQLDELNKLNATLSDASSKKIKDLIQIIKKDSIEAFNIFINIQKYIQLYQEKKPDTGTDQSTKLTDISSYIKKYEYENDQIKLNVDKLAKKLEKLQENIKKRHASAQQISMSSYKN
jgi:hypothetical protein